MTQERPWYQRVRRWGQTNLTEVDPDTYDPLFWREHWRRTRVQGLIVNAGGIVAYYPSCHPLQRRAIRLDGRDLYGAIAAAAQADGLAVLARMDSNRAGEDFHRAHPDWFAVDRDGAPYRSGEHYIACVNGPYYHQYLPEVLREIIERSHPEGITDNSWSGLDRGRICYCRHCADAFRAHSGLPLPDAADWTDDRYRRWITWGYRSRLAVWDLNNRVTRAAGGPHCLWTGMNAARVSEQARALRDHREICRRAPILMLDSQARHPGETFSANTEAGLLVHELLGWDKLVPESTALYQAAAGGRTFRQTAMPEPEVRLWAAAAFAGGIQPWWHHIGARHEDRRQYRAAGPLFQWHQAHDEYLTDREPLASVGVLWSQRNTDFFGRDDPRVMVDQPFQGVTRALRAARIPCLPVHADDIAAQTGRRCVLVLPNLGAMSSGQCAQLRAFTAAGGSLIATGESSRYDQWGERLEDFQLADLLGVHAEGGHHGAAAYAGERWDNSRAHSYLRLHPARLDGPGARPVSAGGLPARHPALEGFQDTDILPFGGRLEVVRADPAAEVAATFVRPFPVYPPETSWMREPDSALPALVLRERPGSGRTAYLAADVDRCAARDNQRDHARLLANLVRWMCGELQPLSVAGPGSVDCRLYRQRDRLIVHLVNETAAFPAPVTDLVPVGPFVVTVRVPGLVPATARALCGGRLPATQPVPGGLRVTLDQVADHEVLVLE